MTEPALRLAACPELPEVLEHVRRRAQAYFPELPRVDQFRLCHSSRRAYSEIHHCACFSGHGEERRIVVKVSAHAGVEFAALQAAWPRFANQRRYRIPRPLDYLPLHAAYVMETVEGEPMVARLPQFLWPTERILRTESDCRRAGEWLRFYHDLGREAEMKPLGREDVWPGLDATLRDLSKSEFGESFCPLFERYFVPLTRRVVGERRPVSRLHGDFTVDNVWVNGDQVIALDLSGELRNVVDLDIAAFLNSLVLLRLSRPVPWKVIDRASQAFLSGYFGGGRVDLTTVDCLRAVGLADVALEIADRRRSRTLRAWLGWTVRRAIRRIGERVGNGYEL